MRKLILASLAGALSLTITVPAYADSFTLKDASTTSMGGVSPFAMSVNATTDRVFHSAGEQGGWVVSTCTVGGPCTDQPLGVDFGVDYTQVTLSDGSQRAYFVIPDPSGKEIATAPVTYVGNTPQLGTVTRLGIKASAQERAWGVPDSVVTPDGRVRLYWVESGQGSGSAPSGFSPTPDQQRCLVNSLGAKRVQQFAQGTKVTGKAKKALRKCSVPLSAIGSQKGIGASGEVIASATSTDASGTSFVRDAGYRTTGGYVDSAVIQAKTGDWVMLLSTGPGKPPQQLFAATSADGLSWKIDAQPLTSSNVNSLDPTAIQTSPNSWRVYFSQSPKATPFSGHRIYVGTLTR